MEAGTRAQRQFKCWRSLERPLHWMRRWTQDAIRQVAEHSVGDAAITALEYLAEELNEAPTEYQSVPALIGLWHRANFMMDLMIRDARAGCSLNELNEETLQQFQSEVTSAIEEEQHEQTKNHRAAWRDWVKGAGTAHPGWVHRWTALRQPWRPLKASGGASGRPIDTLTSESHRLGHLWQCTEEETIFFEDEAESWRDLPPIEPEAVLAAARTFAFKTSQTWDGFHPRHFALLTLPQAHIVARLYQLMERTGVTSSVIRSVVTKLIPKHRAGVEQLAMRGIGLMAALYRHWQRLRQPVARAWERRHREAMLAHQAGRSVMETVFVQALRSEAACTKIADGKQQYSAFFMGPGQLLRVYFSFQALA